MENVPTLNYNCLTPGQVRREFWRAWKRAKAGLASTTAMIADCGWPVEARFLAACVEDDPVCRNWEGPYPLHELASIVALVGLDPLESHEEPEVKPDPLESHEEPEVKHDPLEDARASARLLTRCLNSLSLT